MVSHDGELTQTAQVSATDVRKATGSCLERGWRRWSIRQTTSYSGWYMRHERRLKGRHEMETRGDMRGDKGRHEGETRGGMRGET